MVMIIYIELFYQKSSCFFLITFRDGQCLERREAVWRRGPMLLDRSRTRHAEGCDRPLHRRGAEFHRGTRHLSGRRFLARPEAGLRRSDGRRVRHPSRFRGGWRDVRRLSSAGDRDEQPV